MKDAEIITLKYAVLEMHKKIEELQRKLNVSATARTGARTGVGARAGVRPGIGAKPVSKPGVTTPRQRSRTPTSSSMSNRLNTSTDKAKLSTSGIQRGSATRPGTTMRAGGTMGTSRSAYQSSREVAKTNVRVTSRDSNTSRTAIGAGSSRVTSGTRPGSR